MGQPISVTEKQGLSRDVVRFELNRSLTGMGQLRYSSKADAVGDRPADELARRMFDHGGIVSVHVYSNVVTVRLEPGATTTGLADEIRDLFLFYRAGEPEPAAPTDGSQVDASSADAGVPLQAE